MLSPSTLKSFFSSSVDTSGLIRCHLINPSGQRGDGLQQARLLLGVQHPRPTTVPEVIGRAQDPPF